MSMNESTPNPAQTASTAKTIAVFGVGPGLGQAVARRFAQAGYTIVLVARRREPLDRLAKDLSATGATVYAIAADLSDIGAIPALAAQIRAQVGKLDAF